MDAPTIVAIISGVAAVFFGWMAFRRSATEDDKEEGRESGAVFTELGYIKANTEEIKAEQKEQRKTNTEFITRLTAVEASAKQAHARIDLIEKHAEGR